MLTQEQAQEIKFQLIEQIEKNFPDDKKEIAINQINSMNEDRLEEFLKQNNISTKTNKENCIFCSIINNETPSYKIEEDKISVAVLEINPISEGHSLIIPKEHSQKISEEILKFADKISKKIKSKLKSKKTEIIQSNFFGHEILNILPIYNDETINSQRKKASENELKETLKKINEKKTKEKKIKIKKEEIKEKKPEKENQDKNIKKTPWLPLRIP